MAGGKFIKDLIELDVYADEIIEEDYICFGCLFVPLNNKRESINSLKDSRCQGRRLSFEWDSDNCSYKYGCKKEYHDLNNSEIHFQNIDHTKSKTVKTISKDWLKLLLRGFQKNLGHFYVTITYIELKKMDLKHFGHEKVIETIYNRFFRSSILGGAKYFFNRNYNKITINSIYHDQSDSKEGHEYFPWHTGYKINSKRDKKVSVINEDIIFLDSNHRYYLDNEKDLVPEAQFIQLIDLIIGTTRQNIYDSSKDSFKNEIAMEIRPVLKNLLEDEYDIYQNNYRNYVSISFFPKTAGIENEKLLFPDVLREARGNFYNHKKLQMEEFDPKQKSLDFFK